MTKTFNKQLRGEFTERLIKINKKLAKYGKEISILSETEKTTTDEQTHKTTVWVTVDLSGPEILHNGRNVQHIGTISFKDGVKQIYNADENSGLVLGNISDSDLHCDHCHIDRYRVKYFFFREEEKVLMIGSSCAVDYFGFDIERYLDTFSAAMDGIDEDFCGGGHIRQLDHIYDVIVATYLATKEFKGFWISKEKDPEHSTVSQMRTILYLSNQERDAWAEELRAKIAEAYATLTPKFEDMLSKIQGAWCINPTNDFEWNIKNNLFYNGCDLREYIVSIGIVGYAIYKVFAEPIHTERKTSEHMGTVDSKIAIKAKVVNLKKIDSMYGESTLVMFEDETGNSLKTFTTSKIEWTVGETYNIKGTVKSHDEYMGKKSTLLKRVTLVKE